MADCALCGHPRIHHQPKCVWRTATVCGCPGFEPPEDEEND